MKGNDYNEKTLTLKRISLWSAVLGEQMTQLDLEVMVYANVWESGSF